MHGLLFEEADGFHFEMLDIYTHSYLLLIVFDEHSYSLSLLFNLLHSINKDEVIEVFVICCTWDLLNRLFNLSVEHMQGKVHFAAAGKSQLNRK